MSRTTSLYRADRSKWRHQVVLMAIASAVAGILYLILAVSAPPVQAATAPYDDAVYYAVNQDRSGLLTPWETEAQGAVKNHGYDAYSSLFLASQTNESGLYPVYRLYNKTSQNFFHTIWASERDTAVSKYGYTYQKVDFYASRQDTAETEPVHRYRKGGYHRYAVTDQDRQSLLEAGYKYELVAFYAAPATVTPPVDPEEPVDPVDPRDADGKFSVAVMPDTQREVFGNDQRFNNRTSWLANNKDSLDLRFVGHSGDVVNWGWLVPSQFTIASNAMRNLENANIPYALAIGNHDTRAVGHDGVAGSRAYGGSAYVNNPECVERLSVAACQTGLLQHDTREFNAVFNADRYKAVAGAYQAGKVDNIYSTFDAAGKKWMMLTLEMNPRVAVVNWAKSVVQANPDHNVLIQTHQYLNADGSISQSNGYGDGSRSAQHLFDNLVKQYPNIVATFSGHVGSSHVRTDTGVNGNKIVSYLQAFHSRDTNPVRLLEIDTNTSSITTSVYAPFTNQTMVNSSTQSGLKFVNP